MKTIAASLILAGLIPTSAQAVCGQPQPRLVCGEYFSSEAVVEAKVVRSTYIAPQNEIDGHIYEMKTEEVLSGNPGSSFDIWEENSSGRAGFEWKSGRSYLLFLTSKKNRGWELDGCGNSGPLEHAAVALKQIRAISARQGGMIQVAVGGDWIEWSPPVTEIEVRASNSQRAYSAITNRRGIAEIRVPAGQYTVTVPNHRVQAFDFTYDYPEKITIENGECAQVQLVQSPDQR
jgi:hypothetical protein